MRQLQVNIQGIPNSSVSNFERLMTVIHDLFDAEFEQIDALKNFKIASLVGKGNVANVTKGFLSAYLVRRLIALARQVRVEKILGLHKDHESEENSLAKRIESIFNVNSSKLTAISRILIQLIDEVSRNKIKKNKKHGQELASYAESNDLRCYICGSRINYMNPDEDYSLQLEHHVPRIHGGSKSHDNIFVSCKKCNTAKENFINWQESGFNLFHKHLINIEKDWKTVVADLDVNDSDSLSSLFGAHVDPKLIFIVSSLCSHSCYICQTPNDDAGECYLAPKETDDYFHPLNLMVLCQKCKDEVDASSWAANQILPMVRVSNV